MFKNTRLSAMLAAVLFSVTAASALVSAPAFADAPAAGAAAPAADAAAALATQLPRPLLVASKPKKCTTRTASKPCGKKATSSTRAPSSSCR
jgi:biopolymer transport protein ExbB